MKQASLVTIGMIAAVLFSALPGNATVSSPGSPATASYPRVDPRVVAKAKEWFHRFQIGDIDRSQLNLQVNEELTPKLISQEVAMLKPLGSPLAFVCFRSEPIRGAIGYDFAIAFKAARVAESIAFDNSGKIAGINFQCSSRAARIAIRDNSWLPPDARRHPPDGLGTISCLGGQELFSQSMRACDRPERENPLHDVPAGSRFSQAVVRGDVAFRQAE